MKWKMVKMGKLVNVLSGFAFDSVKFNSDGGTPLIRIRDIKRGYTETYYSGEYDSSYIIRKGDILIGMDGEFNIAAWFGNDALLNQRVCKITSADTSLLDEKYMLFFLPLQLKKIEDKASFVTVKHLSVKDIREIEIPLPPLSVQREIAKVLDRADMLRQKDQLLLQKYDELAQSVFYDMFGDPVRNEKGWEVYPLEDFVNSKKYSLKRGPFGGALKKEIFVKSGYLVYEQYHAINDKYDLARYYIDNEKYNELEMFSVEPGDLIVSCSGVTLGRISEIPVGAKKGIINQALLKISLDNRKITNEFFMFQFRSPLIQGRLFSTSRGSGIPNFPPMEDIKKLLFFVPPVQTQKYFTDMFNNIQRQCSLVTLTTSELLYQAELYKYFR